MRAFAASLATGVLIALSFPGRDWDALAWVGLLPAFAVTTGVRPAIAFRRGWLASATTFVASLYWISLTITQYTWLPFVVAVIPCVLLSAVVGVYGGVAAAVWAAADRRGLPLIVAAPAAWVAMEWVRSFFPIGFPWLLLGYALHQRLSLIQIADATGIYGVSALVVTVNAALFTAIRRDVTHRSRLLALTVALVAVAGSATYGSWRIGAIEHLPPTATLRAALVQGNIEQFHKWDPAYQDETLARYERLSAEAAAQRPDIVVWPETAAPFFFQLGGDNAQRVSAVAARLQAPLLFGSPAFDYDEDGTSYMTNRAYALDGHASVIGSYDKQVLVPFGEYVPLAPLLPFVGKVVEGAAPFRPGSDDTPLVIGQQRYGVLICYEAIFPALARDRVRHGATVLANITNDAWFGRTTAPAQHLAMAAFRAVENRRPLIRAANTGYSAAVDVTGRVAEQTELFTTTYRVATISWPALTAPYTAWGDWFAELCAGVTAIMIAACVVRWRRG